MVVTKDSILNAKVPEDVFGDDSTKARTLFRHFSLNHHPDRGGDEEVFKKLSVLWATAEKAIKEGTYGTGKSSFVNEVRVQTKRNAYRIVRPIQSTPVYNLYLGKQDDTSVIFKVCRSVADNKLLVRESKVLKELLKNKDIIDHYSWFIPPYIESFGFKGPRDKKPKQTNVFSDIPDQLFTLEEVKKVHPILHPKDMAWIFRRLLIALGATHQAGFIHGAITPNNVLVQAENHGLVLANWIHSPEEGERIKTAEQAYYPYFYPSEVLNKQAAGVGTDIYMAARTMSYMLTEKCKVRPLNAFLRGCMSGYAKRRPQDAHALLEEFDELLVKLWGPRKFHPFSMSV